MASLGVIYKTDVRVCLHQASASTLRPLCDDACDSVLIENSGVPLDWGCNLFSSDSHWFQWQQNRKRHRSVDADAWCKRALKTVLGYMINLLLSTQRPLRLKFGHSVWSFCFPLLLFLRYSSSFIWWGWTFSVKNLHYFSAHFMTCTCISNPFLKNISNFFFLPKLNEKKFNQACRC